MRRSSSSRRTYRVVVSSLLAVLIVGAISLRCWERYTFAFFEWKTPDGAVTLYHCPAKQHTFLMVNESYRGGGVRRWMPSYSGGLMGGLRLRSVPPPEELFLNARFPSGRSGPTGLAFIYDEISAVQKTEIGPVLQAAYEDDARFRENVRGLLLATRPAWLAPVPSRGSAPLPRSELQPATTTRALTRD